MSETEKRRPNPNKRALEFDLFAQLSYMSALSTAGVSRRDLFAYVAELPYSTSVYFRNISMAARKLNIDYAEACRMEAGRTRAPDVRSLLLRLAGSLTAGENETEFLRREAQVIGETYGNRYSREVESLKKWTDAYVALIVAASLIVIVAVISMMVYPVGVGVVVGLALAMITAACLGAWTIYVSAPKEFKTRVKGPSSRLQKLGVSLFKICVPLAIASGSLVVLFGLGLGWALVLGGLLIFPPGFLFRKDDANLTRKEEDVATVVRVLGGVTAATGTTVADSLGKVDHRSMGSLKPEVMLLHNRLKAGVDPDLCWTTLVEESGSELVERTVQMFWHSISLGGEPGEVGNAAAFFSSKIAYLRASRKMVALTFEYLILPLQIALVGLLEFILEIMDVFSSGIGTPEELTAGPGSALASTSLDITTLFTFGQINMELVNVLVTSVVLVIMGRTPSPPGRPPVGTATACCST